MLRVCLSSPTAAGTQLLLLLPTLHLLLLGHQLHDVLHQKPSLLSVRWRLGLLHQVGDLDTPVPQRLGDDAQLTQDGQVLSVGEVDGMDIETRGRDSFARSA